MKLRIFHPQGHAFKGFLVGVVRQQAAAAGAAEHASRRLFSVTPGPPVPPPPPARPNRIPVYASFRA